MWMIKLTTTFPYFRTAVFLVLCSFLLTASLNFAMAELKVALVTGGNKGIGFQIAKKLGASNNRIKTIIGCRSSELGEKAADELRAAGCDVVFKQLDITDLSSINALRDSISSEFGKLDILVNNAGIAFKLLDPLPLAQQVAPTISSNYFGTVNVINALLPLLRESSSPRIVNVASKKHNLTILPTEERTKKFTSPKLQVDELNSLMREFVIDVESGDPTKMSTWPKTTYGMSKLGMVTVTNVLAREEPKIMINACCPGFCATDMSSHKGTKTSEEGARTPAMVALLPEELKCTGKFFSDEKEIIW